MRRHLIVLAAVVLVIFSSCEWVTELIGANAPPVANAGADFVAYVGELASLDGSGSSDPDGDAITFSWELTGFPQGTSIPVVNNPTSQISSFTPEGEGNYIVRLTVGDGIATHSDTVTITVEAGTGGAGVDPNVQVTSSSVTDGQASAPISNYIAVEFNVPMDWNSFNNVVTFRTSISQDFIALTQVPDPNQNVILFLVPSQLQDPASNKLYSNETYTMTIPSAVLTAQGLLLPADIVITFTTFVYGEEFDDSATMTGETWDVAYHPTSNSLFYVGETTGDYVVRRYALGTGLATTELIAASTQVLYGGIDLWDDILFVNESYDSEVTEYPVNANGSLVTGSPTVYAATTLASPADTLSEVLNTAKIGTDLYFSTGNWHGGTSFQDIIKYDGANWSVAVSGSVHGFNNDEDKNIVALNVGGTDYIYLAEGSTSKLYKFRASDGALINSVSFSNMSYSAELEYDLSNNIYLGTSSGIYKFSSDLVLIDERAGVSASRIAVKDSGGSVTVYYIGYRNPAVIGFVQF